MSDEELRMEAYYYSFDKTGVREIDLILSAVACAGKAYHHTDQWTEECTWPGHKGETPVEWVQNAANAAAAALAAANKRAANRLAVEQERDKLREALAETLAVATRNEEGDFADRARAVLEETK
jgi:hypothetical protein